MGKEISGMNKTTISIIIAVLIQCGGAIWWLSQLNTKVSVHDEWINDNQKSIDSIDQLEARIDALNDTVHDIENRLNDLSVK